MNDKNVNWLYIFIAGIFEVVWAVAMGQSDAFTNILYDAIIVIGLAISMVLLSKAIDGGLPVGVAYAVWTGIGAVGTMVISVLIGVETITILRILFIVMIIAGIVGLQISSKTEKSK
ncbi:MAG: multidrug efflux SMR transporter [Candidatus Methanomethylophilaceae archaeon]|jgi:quaternary ammonium compound-resistance protein SugE